MKRFAILAREGNNTDGMAANIKDFTLREDGTDDTAQLLTRPDLSLYCFDLERKEAVFVSTPPEIDLEDAPFYYHAQFRHAQAVFAVDFGTFLKLSARIAPPDTLVMIHNIGRCGSTLLSKAFSQLESCTSYSEPDCFTQIAFWRKVDDPRDELWKSLLPACMNFIFCHASSHRPSRAIVKFRSGCLNLLDLFLEGFPDAKHLFLYRNCESWVASLIGLRRRRHPITLLTREESIKNRYYHNGRCVDQSMFPFDRLPEMLTWSEDLAVSWLMYLELVTKIQQSHPGRLLPVTYEDLATNGETCLRRIFTHCDLPQDRLADSLKTFDHDSQAGTGFARVEANAGSKRQLSESDRAQMRSILSMHPFIHDPQYTIRA
ncbi:MAG: hypothetical protein ABSD58_04755 [Verrucomicrobiia bacterium]|jgi:hypothetical protein